MAKFKGGHFFVVIFSWPPAEDDNVIKWVRSVIKPDPALPDPLAGIDRGKMYPEYLAESRIAWVLIDLPDNAQNREKVENFKKSFTGAGSQIKALKGDRMQWPEIKKYVGE